MRLWAPESKKMTMDVLQRLDPCFDNIDQKLLRPRYAATMCAQLLSVLCPPVTSAKLVKGMRSASSLVYIIMCRYWKQEHPALPTLQVRGCVDFFKTFLLEQMPC